VKSFQGKVAAITGAGSGMGRELAYELANRGCHVAISDVNESGLAETAAGLKSRSVRVTTAKVDVSSRAEVHAWADSVVKDHGKVNLIFNNAGVALGSTLEGVTYEDFEWIMNINFWGVVHGTKAFLPHLRASGEEAHIINTSSVFGLIAVPGNGTYNATKFAVRGFTEALRQELELGGGNVSATSVHPGGIKTGIARNARMRESVNGLLVKDIETGIKSFEKNFITTANRAALIILRAVEKNQRRVLVGPDAMVIDAMVRLLPQTYQRLVLAGVRRQRGG
jgi:NAD(P)-dependent dehydrogenase (short-subunit alcohol dehydrogenase family)